MPYCSFQKKIYHSCPSIYMLTRYKHCPWSPSFVVIPFWEFDLVSQLSLMLKPLIYQKILGIPVHSFLAWQILRLFWGKYHMGPACHWFRNSQIDKNIHILIQESRWYTLKCVMKILHPEWPISEYKPELNNTLGSLKGYCISMRKIRQILWSLAHAVPALEF